MEWVWISYFISIWIAFGFILDIDNISTSEGIISFLLSLIWPILVLVFLGQYFKSKIG